MMMGFGLIVLLVVLALIAGLVVWVIIRLFPEVSVTRISQRASHDTSVDILKQRYARGEISRGEYDEMSRVLQAR